MAVLKYTEHARLKTRSSLTDNLLCFVGTMLQPVFATDTDSGINIRFRNMDLMTSTQIMKLQYVQYQSICFKLSVPKYIYNTEVMTVEGDKTYFKFQTNASLAIHIKSVLQAHLI